MGKSIQTWKEYLKEDQSFLDVDPIPKGFPGYVIRLEKSLLKSKSLTLKIHLIYSDISKKQMKNTVT